MKPCTKTTGSKKKRGKWLGWLLLAGLTVLFFRTMLGEYSTEIWGQLKQMPIYVPAAILGCGWVYTALEGVMYRMMARRQGYSWSLPAAVYTAFYATFYRGITLGSGGMPAMMVDAHRNGIPPEAGFGMCEVQYCVHRAMLLIYALVFLCGNPALVQDSLSEYVGWVLLSGVISACVILVLLGVCVWEPFHRLVKRMLTRAEKRWDGPWEKGKERLDYLRDSTRELLRDRGTLVRAALIEAVKIACWYAIPWLISRGMGAGGSLSLPDSFTVMSFVTVLIGVIPTPGNVASIEVIYLLLMSPVVGPVEAGTGVLLYRFATYYSPCLAGGAVMAGKKLLSGIRKKGKRKAGA